MEFDNAVMPLIRIAKTPYPLVNWFYFVNFEIPTDRAECIPNLTEVSR